MHVRMHADLEDALAEQHHAERDGAGG